jgi:hypothetical protein
MHQDEMDEWEMDGDCHGLGLLFRPTLTSGEIARRWIDGCDDH